MSYCYKMSEVETQNTARKLMDIYNQFQVYIAEIQRLCDENKELREEVAEYKHENEHLVTENENLYNLNYTMSHKLMSYRLHQPVPSFI